MESKDTEITVTLNKGIRRSKSCGDIPNSTDPITDNVTDFARRKRTSWKRSTGLRKLAMSQGSATERTKELQKRASIEYSSNYKKDQRYSQ